MKKAILLFVIVSATYLSTYAAYSEGSFWRQDYASTQDVPYQTPSYLRTKVFTDGNGNVSPVTSTFQLSADAYSSYVYSGSAIARAKVYYLTSLRKSVEAVSTNHGVTDIDTDNYTGAITSTYIYVSVGAASGTYVSAHAHISW